jgi:hypothetical protein
MREVLMVHAAATLAMVGLIWFVQIVHYPLMARVGRDRFARFEEAHAKRTTWVVAPLMLVEAALALVLVVRPPPGVSEVAAWVALGLVVVIWFSTALIQVPLHRRLALGFDDDAHQRLVSSNWIRTAAWSVRGLLALVWLS